MPEEAVVEHKPTTETASKEAVQQKQLAKTPSRKVPRRTNAKLTSFLRAVLAQACEEGIEIAGICSDLDTGCMTDFGLLWNTGSESGPTAIQLTSNKLKDSMDAIAAFQDRLRDVMKENDAKMKKAVIDHDMNELVEELAEEELAAK